VTRYIPAIVTLVSIVLIIAGTVAGEPGSMFGKAIAICLSCIGLG